MSFLRQHFYHFSAMAKAELPPLYERHHVKNTIPRFIELVILFLCFSLLGYRLLHLKNHGFIWLVALLCESWFSFTWFLVINLKWNQIETKTYPERLLQRYLDHLRAHPHTHLSMFMFPFFP